MIKQRLKITALAIGLASLSSANAVDLRLSGFGSIVGTSLLGEEGYWAKNPSGAGYYDEDSDLDFIEESLIGLQSVVTVSPGMSIVNQAISRGQDDFKLSMEQFFFSYDVTPSWNVKAGKIRNPIYLFSDVMDTHYAFGWVRTPGSSYSLSASSINGISAMFTGDIGEVSTRTIVYYGRAKKDPDPFLTELFVNRGFKYVDGNGDDQGLVEHKNDIQDTYGISTEFYYESFTFHAAFMEAGGEHDVKTYADGHTIDEVYDDRDFYDLAISYDDAEWVAIAEWNKYNEVYTSHYLTVGRYFDKLQALLTVGKFTGEVVLANGFTLPKASQEQTDTLSVSLRYDISSSVALKTEFIHFKNEGSLIVPDENNDGKINSNILSVAVDFIF